MNDEHKTNQFWSDDSDEAGVGSVGDRARAEGLSGSGRSVEENALGWLDAEVDESLGVQQGSLDNLLVERILFYTDYKIGRSKVVTCWVLCFHG